MIHTVTPRATTKKKQYKEVQQKSRKMTQNGILKVYLFNLKLERKEGTE